MRKFVFFLLICLIGIPSIATERKKVGLVLGGGGAKGSAHIGVLKVLENAGIPIDYIAGTSMGAIVGGLYAAGYNASAIDSMIKQMNWPMLLSDRVDRNDQSFPQKENSERYVVSLPFGKEKKDRAISGVIKGQNLLNLFSDLTIGYHDSIDFNTLPIPFAAVAVDAVTGKEYVFHNGSLPLAIRASMTIPGVFTPVRIDSMLLIDGGVDNNFPVDVARAMGADIIIGVDLGTNDLKILDKINTPPDLFGQLLALHGHDKYEQNKKQTDLLIRPVMTPYTAASFTAAAIDTLIDRGEQAAYLQWDEIMALKQKIGGDSLLCRKDDQPFIPPALRIDTIHIRHISFEGIDPRDEKWLRQISGLKENSLTSLKELKKAMSILIGTNAYSNVSYKLTGKDQKDLILTVQEKTISSVNAGLRFDSEELASVLLNGTLTYRARYRSKVAFTGRIGQKSYARLDYEIERTPLRNFNLAYMFLYQDLNIFSHGEKIANASYRHHFVEFGYSDMNWLNFKFKLGARYEYYDYTSLLYIDNNQKYDVKPGGLFSYFAEAHFETLDRRYFPSKGVSLQAGYSLYTDNMLTFNGQVFSALNARFTSVLPLNSHLALLPSLNGRVLIGHNPAYPYLNAIGGEAPGKYLPQQIPFAGVNHIEIVDNSVIIAGMHLRQRIGHNHYISLIGNYGVQDNDFFHLFNGQSIWGGSIGYAYNSIFGPWNANFGLSNRNNNLQFYLNLGYYF